MRLLAALLWDRRQRTCVLQAFRGQTGVRFLDSGNDLVSCVWAGDVRAVVTALRAPSGQSLVETLCALRTNIPSVPILAYIDLTPPNARELVRAIQGGINGVIIAGEDDSPARLRRALLDAGDSSAAAQLIEVVHHILPARLRPVFEAVATRTSGPLSVSELALACGVSRRTLVNRLRKAAWPTPRRLIAWSRLLHASIMLDDLGRPIERVAIDLDFPSAPSLTNMLHRYVGLSASQLRGRGAFQCVSSAFVRECTEVASGCASTGITGPSTHVTARIANCAPTDGARDCALAANDAYVPGAP
ncbi:MAG: helix-turn-helix domain-containing protein [Gemmatimonadaceae bacterium]